MPEPGSQLAAPDRRALRRADRLTLLVLALCGLGYLAVTVVRLVANTNDTPQIQSDFHALWSYARIAMTDGARSLYDNAHLWQAELALGRDPARPAPLPFAYPPHALLLLWPLGWFSYGTGYLLFELVSFGLLLWASPRRPALLLLVPTTAINLWFGQSGFLFAALLIGGMRLVGPRPILAGVLLGLASAKPQLGLLVPVALLAIGAWRTIGAAAATIAVLVALTSLLFGLAIWPSWLAVLPDYAARFNVEMAQLWSLVPTVEGTLRLLGQSEAFALAVQIPVTLLVAALVAWRYRRAADDTALACLCAGTFLATPHAFVYDLPLVTAGFCLLHENLRRPVLRIVALAVALLPVLLVNYDSALPVAAPILALFFALLIRSDLAKPEPQPST